MEANIKVLIICKDEGESCPLLQLLSEDKAIICSTMTSIGDEVLYNNNLAPFLLKNEVDTIILCDSFQQLSILQTIKLFKEKDILIPIIVISSRNETSLAVEVMKAGGENFLVRNELSSSRLIDTVYSALQSREEQKQLKKVRIENQKLSQTIEQSPVSIVITDAETNKIEYANPMFSKLTGYSLQEVIGESPSILKSGKKTAYEYKYLWETILSGLTWKGEFVNRKKDGSLYCVAATISPIKINNSETTHFVGIHQDISQQKRAELDLKSYARKLENKSEELESAYESIEENIQRARRLHRHFFPNSFPEMEEVQLDAFYEPADKIGSDYYNFVKINNQLIIYVVDVSGSGISGAFINIFIRQKINRFLYVEEGVERKRISPKEMLNFLAEEFLQENFPEEYYICFYVCVLDLETKQLTYSNAGIQVPPALIKNGELESLTLGGLPISRMIDIELLSYEEETVLFDENATLVIATDGLVESVENGNGNMYGIERFQEIVRNYYFLPPKQLKNVINSDIQPIIDAEYPNDDITYVIIQQNFEVIDKKQFISKSDCNDVECIVGVVTDWLQTYTVDVNSLLIGFTEMLYNAIEHGNKFDQTKKVVIEFEVLKTHLLITIEDEGGGFDWRNRLKSQLDLMNFEERGRGIIFTKASFDYVTYNDIGNKVYLYKRLDI